MKANKSLFTLIACAAVLQACSAASGGGDAASEAASGASCADVLTLNMGDSTSGSYTLDLKIGAGQQLNVNVNPASSEKVIGVFYMNDGYGGLLDAVLTSGGSGSYEFGSDAGSGLIWTVPGFVYDDGQSDSDSSSDWDSDSDSDWSSDSDSDSSSGPEATPAGSGSDMGSGMKLVLGSFDIDDAVDAVSFSIDSITAGSGKMGLIVVTSADGIKYSFNLIYLNVSEASSCSVSISDSGSGSGSGSMGSYDSDSDSGSWSGSAGSAPAGSGASSCGISGWSLDNSNPVLYANGASVDVHVLNGSGDMFIYTADCDGSKSDMPATYTQSGNTFTITPYSNTNGKEWCTIAFYDNTDMMCSGKITVHVMPSP